MPSRPEHVDFVAAVEQAPTADALGGRLSELNEELLVLLEQGGAESARDATELALSLVEAGGMKALRGLIARLCEQWRAGEYTDPRPGEGQAGGGDPPPPRRGVSEWG